MKQFLIYIILSVLSVVSCHSQNKEEMKAKATELIGNLYKDVQYQDSAVNYHLGIQIGACAFEVLVNDFIVYRDRGNSRSGSIGLSAYINTNILKSGTQTWEVRVYPPEVDGKRLTTLPEGVRINLTLEKMRFKADGGIITLAEPYEIFTTPLIIKDGGNVYADAGKPAMVYKGTFQANVPYNLTGWSKSKDLTKMDKDKLETMLVNEYKSFGQELKNGEIDKIAERILKREQETAQALFYTKTDNEKILQSFIKGYGREGLQPYPIENYKMTFWGNGRMVTLERVDYPFVPALAAQYFVDGDEYTSKIHVYFHIPEGSDKLEIIR